MSAVPVRDTALPVAGALLRKPRLWVPALLTLGRLARPGWWRRRPYLPLPDDRLWAFRMETVYGRPDADPDVEDVLAYLDWCRRDARRRGLRRGGVARRNRGAVWGTVRGDPAGGGAVREREPDGVGPAHGHLTSDRPD
jgi:hypothetical protein